jgi:hypothetical protein
MKKMLRTSVLLALALFAPLLLLFAGTQPVAEAAQAKEQSAHASWTKCSGSTCTDTVIIGTIRGSNKTLSFEETTYKKSNGQVVSRREAFARNVNFKQNGLNAALVNVEIAVKQCNSKDVCKKGGPVQVRVTWTGKGKTRTDPEDGSRVRDATVTGTVAGKNLGNLNFATLTERTG